jgi:hypothetical protein
MDEVPVDVNQRRLSGFFVDDVRFPDFFKKSAWRHTVGLIHLSAICRSAPARRFGPLHERTSL